MEMIMLYWLVGPIRMTLARPKQFSFSFFSSFFFAAI